MEYNNKLIWTMKESSALSFHYSIYKVFKIKCHFQASHVASYGWYLVYY